MRAQELLKNQQVQVDALFNLTDNAQILIRCNEIIGKALEGSECGVSKAALWRTVCTRPQAIASQSFAPVIAPPVSFFGQIRRQLGLLLIGWGNKLLRKYSDTSQVSQPAFKIDMTVVDNYLNLVTAAFDRVEVASGQFDRVEVASGQPEFMMEDKYRGILEYLQGIYELLKPENAHLMPDLRQNMKTVLYYAGYRIKEYSEIDDAMFERGHTHGVDVATTTKPAIINTKTGWILNGEVFFPMDAN